MQIAVDWFRLGIDVKLWSQQVSFLLVSGLIVSYDICVTGGTGGRYYPGINAQFVDQDGSGEAMLGRLPVLCQTHGISRPCNGCQAQAAHPKPS
jgi:hypothetical protein